ncbi:hypothetical protein [Aeromicrobium fastidiosum]|uniref:Uncharacterized protein n=2 Tax=Aeromicrobium fastidiosum TaxID=52699 RepID=A0A641ART3_9ACTN|nr:hypothetical protein [Aeromicrobium fastidiosum]KAA1379923.1 hypothetical protein ESP62_001540 [Aeromicrobium fastidiosum]MBP2389429.1 hypothetical protein [Aeromicrobium fastidiosum]
MIDLARRAAALIPEPPADVVNQIEWRELVWETARRLADRGPSVREMPGHLDAAVEFDGSSEHLLQLAAMFQRCGASSTTSSTPRSTRLPHPL